MSTDEYVPDDQDMRRQYVVKRMHDGATRTHAEREYTRWLTAHDARVRRDAAREALDGYALWEQESFLELHTKGAVMSAAACQHAQFAAAEYRDTNYPEGDTP